MPTVADVLAAIHAEAPAGLAASWDASGLSVGDPAAEVRGVLVALDLTPAVIEEADAVGATLILTHHPLLFRPAKRVVASDPTGALVLALAARGIATASAHTNLDAAPAGVSVALAHALGLAGVRVLAPTDHPDRKVVVTVPPDAADSIRNAITGAGGGRIGAYAGCSFSSSGQGRFLPLAGAMPATGAVGTPETTDEVRIEAVVPAWRVGAVRAAIAAAHPYETPAIDVYVLDGEAAGPEGYGAVGTLPAPEPLPAFLARVADRLDTPGLRYVGDDEASVARIAVCGGSGLSFLPAALAAGVDAYVTADVTYHRWFEALDAAGRPRLALVDPGHYETERVAEGLLVDLVERAFPDLPVTRTRHRTSPVRAFAGGPNSRLHQSRSDGAGVP